MKRKSIIFKVLSSLLLFSFLPSCGGTTPVDVKVTTPLYLDSQASVEDRVNDLLKGLSLDEKVGQMLQVERQQLHSDHIKKYYIGSLLSGGGSTPENNSPSGWLQMLEGYQQQALSTPHGIPIIYGVDAVHGHNSVEDSVIFPHNIGLGAANDITLMKEIASVTAEEMLSTGIPFNFSPCVAVAKDPRWGRFYESFGEDPQRVSNLSSTYISELQNKYKIAVSVKHFAADGAAKWGTGRNGKIDQGDAQLSEEELRKIHLLPYEKALEAGAKTIMVSFSSINGVKCHGNKHLITDILKGEMKFQGFVLSDYNGIHQLPEATIYDKVVTAANSGIDMFMEAENWLETLNALKKAAHNGDIKQERIDDAVTRILRVKFELGLFENPLGDKTLIKSQFASDSHKEVAKTAVRESLVLLKNDNNLLPIKAGEKIFVSGPACDSISLQCGGWTISWQGNKRESNGETILSGFKKMASESGGEIITDPAEAVKADISVVVIGEESYAEFMGDDDFLSLKGGLALKDNIKALQYAYSLKKPVIVIMISGRPRIITNEINNWNAFVEAWLPGTEGSAIAEVLYGKYNFKGKLPITWPKDVHSLPSKAAENTLFPFGYGLQY